jgi:microcystin-dependent protein
MSSPFVGEIRCFGFNFAPAGWAFCNGALMAIAENETLFTLIGTTYGGDGVQTFGLPDLRGRIPIHQGQGNGLSAYVIGQITGTPSVTLIAAQMPVHQHTVTAMSIPTGGVVDRVATPTSNSYLSESQPPNGVYATAPPSVTAQFSPKAISFNGGSQPHDNMQPYLALNFCIALFGIFPSQN